MKLISTKNELIDNVEYLDSVLSGKDDGKLQKAKSLIRKGHCFYVVNSNGKYTFYPSKFIGYRKLTLDKYFKEKNNDGRNTNSRIVKILGRQISKEFYPEQWRKLDLKYHRDKIFKKRGD